MKDHGQRLREIARDKRLKQKEIAKILGISPQAVNSDFNEAVLSEKRLEKYEKLFGFVATDFVANELTPSELGYKEKLIDAQEQLILELRKRLQLQQPSNLQTN